MDKTEDLSAFERGMVVDARRTSLCQELQRCWVFHTQQFPVHQEWPTTPKDIQPTGHNCVKHWSQRGPASLWNAFQ